MIKRNENMKTVVNENMRGGDGSVKITHILDKGEYKGQSRLVGVITLEPGHCGRRNIVPRVGSEFDRRI